MSDPVTYNDAIYEMEKTIDLIRDCLAQREDTKYFEDDPYNESTAKQLVETAKDIQRKFRSKQYWMDQYYTSARKLIHLLLGGDEEIRDYDSVDECMKKFIEKKNEYLEYRAPPPYNKWSMRNNRWIHAIEEFELTRLNSYLILGIEQDINTARGNEPLSYPLMQKNGKPKNKYHRLLDIADYMSSEQGKQVVDIGCSIRETTQRRSRGHEFYEFGEDDEKVEPTPNGDGDLPYCSTDEDEY